MLTLNQELFSFSHCSAIEEAGGAQGAGWGKKQDSWPKGYSVPSDIMLNNYMGFLAGVGRITALGQAVHWSVGDEQ